MKNIYGKDENLDLYNDKGVLVYTYHVGSFYTFENTYDKNGNILTWKNSDADWFEYTRDSEGNELTFENSTGTRRGFEQEKFTKEEVLKKFNRLSENEFYRWILTKG
jgi:hypothetical protein